LSERGFIEDKEKSTRMRLEEKDDDDDDDDEDEDDDDYDDYDDYEDEDEDDDNDDEDSEDDSGSSSYDIEDDAGNVNTELDAQHMLLGTNDPQQKRLFVSTAMSNLLRGCVGSESDLSALLAHHGIHEQRKTATVPRCGSDSDFQQPKLVYSIQTTSAVPAASSTTSDSNAIRRPFDTLISLLEKQGLSTTTLSSDEFYGNDNDPNYWVPWNSTGYTIELTNAVRENDLTTIRRLYHQNNHCLQCCNKFGESIVHTAARRGNTDVLQFLHETASVSLQVKCEGGRTVLHDACWTSQPNFECIRFLLRHCPPQFMVVTEKRGFTPLHFCPKDAWPEWNVFLHEFYGAAARTVVQATATATPHGRNASHVRHCRRRLDRLPRYRKHTDAWL
jgi:hypothetical protein